MINQNRNIALTFAMTKGAYLGGIIIIISLFYLYSSKFFSGGLQLFINVCTIWFITNGVRQFRDEQMLGVISFGRAVKAGFAICFWASIIYGFFVFVTFKFIKPELIQQFIDIKMKAIDEISKNMPAFSMMQNQTKEMKVLYQDPFIISIDYMMLITFNGLLFSLIAALFLRKKETINNL